jgi:hypothetical protein
MYCIYQKNNLEKKETAITIIKDPENFISTVSDIVTKAYKINHTVFDLLKDGLITSEHLAIPALVSSTQYEPGYYMVSLGNNNLSLVEKKRNVSGYIISYYSYEIVPVYEWKLLSFEFPVSSEISEEVIPQEEAVTKQEEAVTKQEEAVTNQEKVVIPEQPNEVALTENDLLELDNLVKDIEIVINEDMTKIIEEMSKISEDLDNVLNEERNKIIIELDNLINEMSSC